MPPIIRVHRDEDLPAVERLMVELQTLIVALDPLRRNRCPPEYGREYAQDVLHKIAKSDGRLYVAETEEGIVGCVAVIIEALSSGDLIDHMPLKDARITELVVSSHARNAGVGSALMKAAEEFAREKECDGLRVEVFSPNEAAHGFYRKHGYEDRYVNLIKNLRTSEGN